MKDLSCSEWLWYSQLIDNERADAVNEGSVRHLM